MRVSVLVNLQFYSLLKDCLGNGYSTGRFASMSYYVSLNRFRDNIFDFERDVNYIIFDCGLDKVVGKHFNTSG